MARIKLELKTHWITDIQWVLLNGVLTILTKLRNIDTKKILIGYWGIIVLAYSLYLFLFSLLNEISLASMISTMPLFTTLFLLANLTVAQVILLLHLLHASGSAIQHERTFYLFSIVQQILTMNLIGAFLCYRIFRNAKRMDTNNKDWLLLIGMGLIGTGSVFFLLSVLLLKN